MDFKKALSALIKGRKPMPIGTRRTWQGQDYIKHADGWVAVGGKNHGKLMGKFKGEVTHKDEIKTEPKSDLAQEKIAENEKRIKEIEKLLSKRETEAALSIPSDPRAEAKAEKLEEEYVNARESKISNIGEDVGDSARHRAMEWKNLESLEADGVAEKHVTRDALLKIQPHDLEEQMTPENWKQTYRAYAMIKNFPAKPVVNIKRYAAIKKEAISDVAYYVVEDPQTKRLSKVTEAYYTIAKNQGRDLNIVQTTTFSEIEKKSRKVYYDTFQAFRESINEVLKDPPDSNVAYAIDNIFHKKVNDLASKYDDHSDKNTAYKLYSTAYRKTINGSAKNLREFEIAVNSKDLNDNEIYEKAKEIVSGKPFSKVFELETKKDGKKNFNPADLYVKHAERKGPETGLNTIKDQTEFLTKSAELRAIQWGNSVSDEEREHHLKYASEAFKDLADVLDLPESMISFNGRLALAIGARGRARALAHYEPSQKVINLTRKSGVGSLAHEWGHMIDNIHAETNSLGHFTSNSTMSAKEGTTHASMQKLYNSPEMRSFKSRIRQKLYEMKSKGMRINVDYWSSTEEIWARCFESYVEHKLDQKGRKNTYLAGSPDGGLWPTKEEIAALTPYFDDFFKTFKSTGDFKKALQYLLKAYKDEFDGKGSVVAHTKSGKPIHTHADHPNHQDFKKEDHEDAQEFHANTYNALKEKINLLKEQQPHLENHAGLKKLLNHHKEKADKHKDQLEGGLADNKQPSDFDPEQLKQGTAVEMEHTSDPKIAREIAMDHLTEDPDYYKKLKTIEKGRGPDLKPRKRRSGVPQADPKAFITKEDEDHADKYLAQAARRLEEKRKEIEAFMDQEEEASK